MSETLSVIPSLYLPVSQSSLLLPNVSVAEVVSYQEPKRDNDSLDEFYLGKVSWRGLNIPLLSYELANEQDLAKRSSNARIAVINTIGDHTDKLPFFAIMTQGIPRLVKVNDEHLKKSEQAPGADAAVIQLDGETAVIPDLEYLEKLAYQNL